MPYNPLEYIENSQDIVKISHMLIYGDGGYRRVSPFWDESSQMLLQSTIAYLWEACMKKDRNMINALRMLRLLDTKWIDYENTLFDKMMKRHENQDRNSYAVKMYRFLFFIEKTRIVFDQVLAKQGACSAERGVLARNSYFSRKKS